jgi:hypothetical protein
MSLGWLRGVDLNHRPLGYEPNELPDCSTPRFDDSNRASERQRNARLGRLGQTAINRTDARREAPAARRRPGVTPNCVATDPEHFRAAGRGFGVTPAVSQS